MPTEMSIATIYSSDVPDIMRLRKIPTRIIMLNHPVSLTYGHVITTFPSHSITYCAVARGMFCILVATQCNGVGWRLLKIPSPTHPYPDQRQYKPSGPELCSGEALMDRTKGPLLDRL